MVYAEKTWHAERKHGKRGENMISLRILVFTEGKHGGHVSLDPVETDAFNPSMCGRHTPDHIGIVLTNRN